MSYVMYLIYAYSLQSKSYIPIANILTNFNIKYNDLSLDKLFSQKKVKKSFYQKNFQKTIYIDF